jgi:rhodanese-related sulfurtransferase
MSYLCGMMVRIVFILLMVTGSVLYANAQNELDAEKFSQKIADTTIQLLDVRTAKEYNTGHLPHALQADWTQREQFADRAKSLDKQRPVYVYCLVGGRSAAAAQWLREQGFTVVNLEGGINAWKKANKPVEQPEAVPQISYDDYLSRIPSKGTVLVDIGAPWCPPCRKMAPVIDSIEKQYPKLKVIRIDASGQDALGEKLKVQSFPTFIIYKNGKEVWRKEGVVERSEIVNAI